MTYAQTNDGMLALLFGVALSLAACTAGASKHAVQEDGPSQGPSAPDAAEAGEPELDDADPETTGHSARDGGPDGADAASADQRVKLHFRAVVGAHDYACDRVYPGQGSSQVAVTGRDFRFVVHNVRLIDAAGIEVPVRLEERLPAQSVDLALLDFANPTGSCGATPTSTDVTGFVPTGEYRGVVFGIGVPEALNHADPAQAGAPLRGSSLSWGWLQGYRFFVGELALVEAVDAGLPDAGDAAAEGDAGDTDASGATGGGSHTFEPGIGLVHLGSTGCVGGPASGIACTKQNRPEIRLLQFDPARNTIVADLGAVFAEIDIESGVQCHARGDDCEPMFRALGVDLASGANLPTQTMFRVE